MRKRDDRRLPVRAPVRRSRASWLVAIVALCCAWSTGSLRAEEPSKGSSSREDRQDAVAAIPFDKLKPTDRARVQKVLDGTTIYRRMPVEIVSCDPELYLFLVNRPDAVVNLWEVLGISEVNLRQTGRNTYRADDGHGTLADFEYLHRSHDCHVVIADGAYQGALFGRQIRGGVVMLLRTGYIKEGARTLVTHRLDAFCQLENVGADFLAKTIQPLVGKMADRNFTEISSFMGGVSRKVERDADWGQQIASRLEHVHPTVRDAFSKLAEKLSTRDADEEETSRSAKKTDENGKSAATQEKSTEQTAKRSAPGLK